MRADRLLSELLLLQAHGQLTGREMARRLEVSERTIHRDMEALSASGVPVYALRGAQGGWQLDEDWRTQVPGLDDAELRALLMAQPRSIGDSRLAAAAERALEKLMAAMPEPLRARAVSMRQRLFIDTTAWHGSTEDLALLPVVQEAVSSDRQLSFVYWKAGKERVERTVDPLGLVAKGNAWYLVAQTPAGLRTYRISRFESATILPERCRRPEGFDLARHWQQATQHFRDQWRAFEAILFLEPRVAEHVRTWHIATPAPRPAFPGAGREHWITLKLGFNSEEEAGFVALGLGARAEVIEPESLRLRVAREAAAVAARAQI